MRIDSGIMNKNWSLEGRQRRAQSGGQAFTTALAKSRDTIELSYPSAVPPTAAAEKSAAPESVTIYPTDSVQAKLEKLRMIDENTDYSGMGYVEIYQSAWDRYNKAFDGDMFGVYGFTVTQERYNIFRQFKDEMDGHLENLPHPSRDEYLSVYGYSGMTDDEIEQVIYEKYADKDTLADFLNMQGELVVTGVMPRKLGDGFLSYLSKVNYQLKCSFFHEEWQSAEQVLDSRWNAVLYADGFSAKEFMQEVRASLSEWSFDNQKIEEILYKQTDYLLSVLDRYQYS